MKPLSAQNAFVHTLPLPTPFIVGPVNVYVVEDDCLTLVDTGPRTEEAEAALEAGLKACNLTVQDFDRVILTHHHVDHAGLLQRVLDASGAESWAHPDVKVLAEQIYHDLEGRKQYYLALMAELGVGAEEREQAMALWDAFRGLSEAFRIDHTFEDGGTIGSFTTYFVPGHSASDTLLVNHGGGFTLTGDHILQAFNPNPLLRRPLPGKERGKALVEFQASLRRSRALDLGRCYPGHGEAFDDHREIIDGILARHEEKNQRLLEAVVPEGLSPFEAAKLLYPNLDLVRLYLGLSVATGQLELLEEHGLLYSEHDRGVLRYYRAAKS